MRSPVKNVLWLVVVLLAAGGAYVAWQSTHGRAGVTYRTAIVTKGDLRATIGATGTLEPEEAVDVGAQVAGQISRFGTQDGKPIDRRSFVKTGDLLAQIDPSLYKLDLEAAHAQLAQSKAQLAQSEASRANADAQLGQNEAAVVKAQADVEQMDAKRAQAEEDWNRAQRLHAEGPEVMADAAFAGYKSAYLVAVANVSAAKATKTEAEAAVVAAKAAQTQATAAIEQAKAAISQSQAAVDRAQRNLDYCTITSPVDGVVIDRRVNIGQTVVSSLNAPSLFLIAKDLTRMQIWVSVNEADIGNVRADQPVTFTVDARPGVVFRGTVTKVRFDATMTQNVVTYPVEVLALNPEGLLYPYMTANVQFELDKRTDVMRVPNAALRYAPTTTDQVAPDVRPQLDALAQKSGAKDAAKKTKAEQEGLLWIQDGAFLRPVAVRVGMSDGALSEVQGADLKEGLAVVVAEDWQSPASSGAAPSPFVPQTQTRTR
jgi:HlyD family secretion protein